MTVAPTSTAMFARVLLSNLGTDQASIQHLEAELSTGRSLLAPSDNPSATVAVLGTQAAHARVQGYVASAKDGLSRLGLANQTMGSILAEVSQLQQAVESTSTASLSPVGMAALATRVQGIGRALLGQLNTTYQGLALFGGTSGVSSAYDAAGNYLGNSTLALRTVGVGTQLPVGILGKQAFGTGATGLLGTIAQTVTDLQKGNVKAVLGTDLGAINGWYHQVSDSAAVLGARYDQMASAQTEAHLTAETLSQQVSGLSSTDLASTLTALTLQSSTLKAALYATSKVVPESILAYL